MIPVYTTAPNDHGRSFAVVVVTEGESYGLNDCLTHDKSDPLVEFYDTKHAGKHDGWDLGQFVSRYHLTTLLGLDGWGGGPAHGINLDGRVECWSINAEQEREALAAVIRQLGGAR